MEKINRVTLDDIREQKTPEPFGVIQDKKGAPRVIRKRAKIIPEIYADENELKEAAESVFKNVQRCKSFPCSTGFYICISGLFIAVLAKMPGKEIDQLQEKCMRDVLDAGGYYIVYSSIHELVEKLKKHRLIHRKFKI